MRGLDAGHTAKRVDVRSTMLSSNSKNALAMFHEKTS
jgi:hypothetical protein